MSINISKHSRSILYIRVKHVKQHNLNISKYDNPIAKDAELRNVIKFKMQNLKTLLSFIMSLTEINICG